MTWEDTDMAQGSCLVYNITLSTPEGHDSDFSSDTDAEVKLQAEMKGGNIANLIRNLYLQIPDRESTLR